MWQFNWGAEGLEPVGLNGVESEKVSGPERAQCKCTWGGVRDQRWDIGGTEGTGTDFRGNLWRAGVKVEYYRLLKTQIQIENRCHYLLSIIAATLLPSEFFLLNITIYVNVWVSRTHYCLLSWNDSIVVFARNVWRVSTKSFSTDYSHSQCRDCSDAWTMETWLKYKCTKSWSNVYTFSATEKFIVKRRNYSIYCFFFFYLDYFLIRW